MKFKSLRERAGVSQIDFAKKIGVCQQAVAKWETGVAMPRADKLPEIAKILKCEVSDLFEERG